MRLPQVLRNGRATDGIEMAEEARVFEPLAFSEEQLRHHAVASEFALVCRNPIDGVYIMPSAKNSFNSLFHPNVDLKTRELDMNRYFPDGWKHEKHHVVNVLLVLQRVFFSLDASCESAANPEAAILWKEKRSKFVELVKEDVNRSRANVYEDPPDNEDAHAIRFTPWDTSVHEPVRKTLLAASIMSASMTSSSTSAAWASSSAGYGRRVGYSWVDADNMTYMTEPVAVAAERAEASDERLVHGIERLDLSAVNPPTPDSSPRKEDEDVLHQPLKRTENVEDSDDSPTTEMSTEEEVSNV